MKYNEMPDVTLKMIIDSGLIKPGTKVSASLDHKIIGTLNEDGSISLVIDNQQKTFPFPSGAARAITKTSINGWIFWTIFDSDHYNELTFYKKIYLEKFK